jgi:hypothetical protein
VPWAAAERFWAKAFKTGRPLSGFSARKPSSWSTRKESFLFATFSWKTLFFRSCFLRQNKIVGDSPKQNLKSENRRLATEALCACSTSEIVFLLIINVPLICINASSSARAQQRLPVEYLTSSFFTWREKEIITHAPPSAKSVFKATFYVIFLYPGKKAAQCRMLPKIKTGEKHCQTIAAVL